jgi:hypothetical protein
LPAEGAGAAIRRRTASLTSPGGLFLTAAILLTLVPATSPIRDPDFWWHLRTGQLILDHHGLLSTDPFTYTASDHQWVMHEWLTEVLFAGLHHIGGIGLIVAVLSLVTFSGILLIAARAHLPIPAWEGSEQERPARRVHFLPLGIGMVLAAIAGYPIWGPRAQMLTFALTCLTLWVAERHLRCGGRAIWALVPVFLVWSNLHSGFIIGAGFLGAILVAEAAAHRFGLPGRAPAVRVRTLALVLLACAVVVVVNPNGPHIYLYPFETQGSATQQALIQEWHSPDFHDIVVRAFELMLCSLAVLVAVTRRVRPRDAALALATTAMAMQSVRHIALFIAATTPLWIEQADMVMSRVRARQTARRPGGVAARRRPVVPPPVWFRAAALLLVAGLPLVVEGAKLGNAVATREDSSFYAGDFPVCAARWLEAAPAGLRIFNQYGEGGYLALRLTPRGDRVFIFGDAALMGDALLQRYGQVEGVTPAWQGVVSGSGTDVVLFDAATPLVDAMVIDPRWVEVYRDGHNVAFVPATPAGDALRARLPDPAATRGGDGVCGPPATVASR